MGGLRVGGLIVSSLSWFVLPPFRGQMRETGAKMIAGPVAVPSFRSLRRPTPCLYSSLDDRAMVEA